MADQLTGGMNSCSGLGVHWMGHGGLAPARAGIGRISKRGRADAHAGEATSWAAADRVRNALREAACPAKGTPR